ncbi:hypothetical protein CSUI_003713 [Cystoisospora suis]|uniref:Uncharacterized protein n=1 Tax=Cystoisospora suis TaxID=483139 RepID=A0A2C6L3X9_9APIC|nr:hypothetical protein CSUI_003713 [Cystoisospora suis]
MDVCCSLTHVNNAFITSHSLSLLYLSTERQERLRRLLIEKCMPVESIPDKPKRLILRRRHYKKEETTSV